MNPIEDGSIRLEKLRAKAKKQIKVNNKQDFSQLSSLDIANLVHELETHQVELEIQNEEMQIAHEDLVIVRDQYATLYENAPVGYLTVSEKGIILKTNLTFSKMIKIPQPDLDKQLLSAFIIDEDQDIYYRFLRSLLKTEDNKNCTLRLSLPDKSSFWVSIESKFDQSVYVGLRKFHMIVIDINDQKQNEIKQAQLQRELQQVNKMATIGQLTGGIAHDFNNILGIIMGYTELARLRATKKADNALEAQLDQILEASERGKDLIARMMSFSYRSKDDATALDLTAELEGIIGMLKPVLPSSIITHIDIEPALPPVLMNKVKFNQLLMNLVINARDSMDEHGQLGIHLNWQKALNHECAHCHRQITGDWVQLIITDTGTGITTDSLNRIFEPFYTNKKVGKGTGMGLAIVAGIIHSLGGHILISTELNKGTSFRVLFPPVSSMQQKENTNLVIPIEILDGQGESVLIIDDEPRLASCMSELLEENGYKTVVYNNSKKALECISQNPEKFDLVLTDQTMPELTGIEVATEIRSLRSDLPIILCSGNLEGIDLELVDTLNIFLLEKPAPTKILFQTIKELLHCQ